MGKSAKSKRSSRKGYYIDPSLIKKLKKVMESGKHTVIKTWSRSSCIIPAMVGFTFAVHNGKKFIPVKVTEDMIGMKLGEFSPTRTFNGHSGDKKAKKG